MTTRGQQIRHLLRRAGFGFTPVEYLAYRDLEYDEAVARIINFEAEDNSALETLIESQNFDFTNGDDIKRWWLFRMLFTRRPLEEKLTLFWHGHFATSLKKVRNPYAMYVQNRLFRRLCIGDFGKLLLAVSKDPAMIVWLDNQQNRKGKPNENFAREIMELFTLGIGHYSEADIKEAARAFTGWQVKNGKFTFNKGAHDNGKKLVLGESGNFDGAQVVSLLSSKKQTGQFLAAKLLHFFLGPDFDRALLNKVAAAYEVDRQIRPMLKTIFLSKAFLSRENQFSLVKSPCQYMVGTLKHLQISTIDGDLPRLLSAMGQDLFAPPSVKGWDGGTAWLSSDTMMARFNFANRAVGEKIDALKKQGSLKDLLTEKGIYDEASCVAYFLELLVEGNVPPPVVKRLEAYLGKEPFLKGAEARILLDERLRGLLHLIMTLPTYQLA